MTAVRLENVSKFFDQVVGAKDINITINEGEFFTFLGPSGCGKTTILRMIAGFYYPTTGQIYFGDQTVTHLPPNRRETGMVFQNYALFPHMTVAENVAFGLAVRKLPHAEITERVEAALARVSLAGYGMRRIDQLSGGQQQRVALARALVIQPKILLLDEPLSNLDAKLREETRSEIKRLQLELGITTIYVTHDQAEAMALSDRVMVMEKGLVQQIGDPPSIYNRPANRFVASFIGETNLLEAEITESGAETITADIGGARLAVLTRNANTSINLSQGNRVCLSLRPEAFRRAVPNEANALCGEVLLSEFTGVSMVYLVKIGAHTIRVMFTNDGGTVAQRGETLWFFVATPQVFVVE